MQDKSGLSSSPKHALTERARSGFAVYVLLWEGKNERKLENKVYVVTTLEATVG